jgi:dihydroorotase
MKAPSGGPLVQHAVTAMLERCLEGKITAEKVVEKMCHNPAKLFQIEKRGFIREGYYADLAVVDVNAPWTVSQNNILYKCGWSPFDGTRFRTKVTQTFVNGHLAYDNGHFSSVRNAKRLTFNR